MTTIDGIDIAGLREVTLRMTRRLRRHSDPELTLSQMSALSTLERHGPLRVGDLARHEQIGKSSVTRMIARLEGLGHLDRRVDDADGRSFHVALTQQGQELLTAANDRANAYLAERVAGLSAADRAAVRAALPALQRLVEVRR